MELISKEKLRDRMHHEAFEVDSEMQKWESGCWIRYKLFEKILDEVPIVEIERTGNTVTMTSKKFIELTEKAERPTGKWIKRSSVGNWECSLCGSGVIASEQKLANYNYCPNCGAEMEKEE